MLGNDVDPGAHRFSSVVVASFAGPIGQQLQQLMFDRREGDVLPFQRRGPGIDLQSSAAHLLSHVSAWFPSTHQILRSYPRKLFCMVNGKLSADNARGEPSCRFDAWSEGLIE